MNIVIVIFNDVEELDFVGPYEALSYLGKLGRHAPVTLVSEDGGPVRCANGLRVMADCSFATAPQADWLIVPGGQGRKREAYNPAMLDFVRKQAAGASAVASVCTGSFILVAAGLLKGGRATTYHLAMEELHRFAPDLFVGSERIVRCGKVLTAGGVSAGIDLALELIDSVEAGLGRVVAEKIEFRQEGEQDVREIDAGCSGTVRIGVISDTHLPSRAERLHPGILEVFSGVDLILHAGDLVEERLLAELAAVAPVQAVAGNMDPYLFARRHGRKKIISVSGRRVGLAHGDFGDGFDREGTPTRVMDAFAGQNVQAIVFGHSHIALVEERDGILLFNPGSPTDPRNGGRPSCGLLTVGDTLKAEIVLL